ncbi:hypothetical protein [Amycolatopsis sp. SID8362]|uniref:hypothetical protein n=1 Tax=Amycolatopsis sp. SID8362 TaxID=2690346 RepID=UPI00136CC21D|nr:hypothetical protein [Amycolatopsis sp. SID8362]NBH06740.1 hypothetical protein [Amycolatopsis sp. SID8362]NED43437.1 hypothetical protein [Amycolatopsis sp. SID8362]
MGGTLLVLVLSGCGSEAGPTPKRGGEPGPDALPTKLDALTADQCYASPRTQLPKGCEKYVTEVGNVPGAARKRADDRDPQLVAEADKLDTAVKAFRGASCTTVPDAGGPCTQALVDIAGALSDLKKQVDARPTSG